MGRRRGRRRKRWHGRRRPRRHNESDDKDVNEAGGGKEGDDEDDEGGDGQGDGEEGEEGEDEGEINDEGGDEAREEGCGDDEGAGAVLHLTLRGRLRPGCGGALGGGGLQLRGDLQCVLRRGGELRSGLQSLAAERLRAALLVEGLKSARTTTTATKRRGPS